VVRDLADIRKLVLFLLFQYALRKFTPRMGSLKSRDGKVIGDEEGMKIRWKEY